MDSHVNDSLNAAQRSVTRVSTWFAWIGGAIFLASAILITLDVAARALFHSTFFESYELSSYAFAIATSFGFSYALVTKAHIRIEVIYNLVPKKLQAVLDLFALICLTTVCAVLVYWCFHTVMDNAETGARSSSSLATLLAIPQGIWLLGLAWCALTSLILTVIGLCWFLRGQSDMVTANLGINSLQDEITKSVDLPFATPNESQDEKIQKAKTC